MYGNYQNPQPIEQWKPYPLQQNWNFPIIYYWIKSKNTIFLKFLYAAVFELQLKLKNLKLKKKYLKKYST